MAFKGTTPSTLWLHYNQEGGRYLMELDIHVAMDINDKLTEAHTAAKAKEGAGGLKTLTANDANDVIARRDARRKARQQREDLSDT